LNGNVATAATTLLNIEEIEKETKAFICPHCNTSLQFLVRVSVVGVHESETQPAPKVQPVPKPALVYTMAEEAKQNGIFDAFETAVKVSTPHNIPNPLERYFSVWFSRAHKVKTPQFAIRKCLEESEQDAAGDLELYAFQNIAAVVKDGVLHSFLPYQFVKGHPLPSMLEPNGSGVKRPTQEITLPVWVKTRNGYVLGRGMLFRELRGKAAGQFATTGI
jgi:hypothetical protein